MDVIVNKVAESGIITLDLAGFIPREEEVMLFDLKPFLFREMILKEKDYRAALLSHDWQQYAGKNIALYCTVDAIIPIWAYMLATSYLQPVAAYVHFGNVEELKEELLLRRIYAIDTTEYADKRVVIKGCGDTPIADSAYIAITQHLRPVVKSLMYGEPCSTVPIYKKPLSAK
ncbi:MAG: hypothetical protein BGO69_00670 [Bacteroidetes bacterium 46-16]|nr:MAG: hypothetical protein BGO69_00670 [Bacteroidetes bacterium 46-16]